MVRRSQQAKLEEQRARRAAAAAIGESQVNGSYRSPDRKLCEFREWSAAADDLGVIAMKVRMWKFNGHIVDFVITLEIDSAPTGWIDDVRIDCKHGHAHLHPIKGEPRHIRRLDDVNDVRDALAQSIAFMRRYTVTLRNHWREEDDG